MHFWNFVIISQCKKVLPFHLNKLKSSLCKDAFCQVWLKLAQWFYRRRFLNFVDVFSLFCKHLPLENRGALHFSWSWTPDALSCKCSSNSKLFCRWQWKLPKTSERFGRNALHETIWTLWTERNALRTKRNALGTERNVLRMKTKHFGNGTKRFENGTLLRCSSAVQGLYLLKKVHV